MTSWFNIKKIIQEIKKIKWPSKQEFFTTFIRGIIFVILFMLFFILADFIVSNITKLLGL